MYERAHSGATGQHAAREALRRLEAALAHFERETGEGWRAPGAPAAEFLARTARLLTDEIDRLRRSLR